MFCMVEASTNYSVGANNFENSTKNHITYVIFFTYILLIGMRSANKCVTIVSVITTVIQLWTLKMGRVPRVPHVRI